MLENETFEIFLQSPLRMRWEEGSENSGKIRYLRQDVFVDGLLVFRLLYIPKFLEYLNNNRNHSQYSFR